MTSSLDMIRGRSNIVTLTNKSGGPLVAGDVCILDTSNDEAATTTTSAASVLKIYIAAESIASNASGKFYSAGFCPLVTPSASVTRGRYLFTHTVAKQAAESATYGAGAFGVILKSGTTPSVWLFGSTAQGSGGGIGGSTGSTDNAILRADGTGGATAQSSLATINDSGTVNIPTGQTYNINNSPHTHAGGSAAHDYFKQLCALIEPDALEAVQIANFTYSINSSTIKYLIGSWACQIGAAGRIDLRRPSTPWLPLPLRNVTLTGTVNSAPSRSTAVLLDPSLPTYTDAWTTFYDRLLALTTYNTKAVHLNADSQRVMLLPGAYGAILLHNTAFNFTWLSPVYNSDANGWALENELGDSSGNYQRVGANLLTPIHKWTCNGILSGISTGSTGSPFASVLYALLPSTWSKVTDPNTYDFRDDFMGASLDTATKWTRTVSVAGNIEINTDHQWLKVFQAGGNWGTDGIYSQASITKANGKVFLIDFYIDGTAATIVGFSDGGGHSYTNFAYGVLISSGGGDMVLTVFENSNSRGAVGTGAKQKSTYRLRITTLGNGTAGAKYEIQGGTEYAAMNGATWTDITPGTSSSATTTLHAGIASAGDNASKILWLSDARIY